MQQPDILFFMSDQHTPFYSGFGGGNVDTPALDALCRDGLRFSDAYTPCPLCVPSRVAMLSALRPAKTGVFTLEDALPDMTPTFLHYLVEQGYETVLCGRMHFVGRDQRHGFTRRIADDTTTITWNAPRQQLRASRGPFLRAYGEKFCTSLIGGGESPVSCYDQYVVDTAIEYLSRPHDKPQFLMVGLYAPHFPYVGPRELYEKYRARAVLPESFYDPCPTKVLERHHKDVTEEVALAAQAAYCAMIEELDGRIASVRKAFDAYCDRKGGTRLFLYTSDHGDQVGDRSMFAKSTFYEKSARIPLILAGDGIPAGAVCETPVSIMDIGPTLLEHVGAAPMEQVDGVSLADALKGKPLSERAIYGEFMERPDMSEPANSYCFMLREGDYKYMCFADDPDCELLFDVKNDPGERRSLAAEKPELLAHMRELAAQLAEPEKSVRLQALHTRLVKLMQAYEKAVGPETDELWMDVPPSARELPPILVSDGTLRQ